MEYTENKPGPRRCKKCGETLPGAERVRPNYCIQCLREMTEAPPYPCTSCEKRDNATCMRHLGLRGCSAWADWAMVTWRLACEQLKQRCGRK
jgi:hypothetical protein